MNLFDSHCHLFGEQFRDDLDSVLQRAREHGVTRMVVPAVDAETAQAAIHLAERVDGLYVAAGIHPESLAEWSAEDVTAIEQAAQHPKVVAIGEIGLDYHWDVAPHDVQQEALRMQIQLAKRLHLPVVIHNRESTEDLLKLLEEECGTELTGVMHCFSDTLATARRCLDFGFYISFGGPVTFKNAGELQAVATEIPSDRLLIETDSPYLSPHPMRGKRNEPARVQLVAEKLAELRSVPVEVIAAQTYDNASRLFGLTEVFGGPV
jgi:TatD DNase family protein